METHAHFSNIHKVIIDHLNGARAEIVAAVAWFTDREIFDALCRKSQSGIEVSVALIGDEINKGPGGLNFHRLSNLGGQVILLPPGSRDEPTMHHKFCVIDGATVITGSYNWSHKARSNEENITVVSDNSIFAGKYLAAFDQLIARSSTSAPIIADAEAARRRLELVRNFVLLEELDDVQTHLRKLRPVVKELRLTGIIRALDAGEYRSALALIDAYLTKATAIVAAGIADISRLKFQLEVLELRLESLSDKKAEIERRLIIFNRRHDDALGDVIQRVLKAKAELARLVAETKKSVNDQQAAETAARKADSDYQKYAEQHNELQQSHPAPKLDENAERDLKELYRKACSLCHPDKFSEDQQERAHRAFIELQDAYRSNDLARVREIYETLSEGGMLRTRSLSLNEAETLKAAIAEMEHIIARLVTDLHALQASNGFRLMETAGTTDAELEAFFNQQRKTLEIQLKKTELAIKTLALGIIKSK